jgi:predicted TIM-barrel fold metal-dependent hydrolase
MIDDTPSRREFLRMLLGAGALAAGCASPPEPAVKIVGEARADGPAVAGSGAIDSHVHLWTADVAHYPRAASHAEAVVKPRRYTARDFLATARMTGVERAVLVQPGLYGADHSYLIDVLRAYPDHFVGIGTVDKTSDPEVRMQELAALGMRGVRVVTHTGNQHWIDNEHFCKLFEQASQGGLVLDILCIPDHFEIIDEMCERYPDTLVVVDHLGRLRPDRYDRKDDLDAISRMARHPRVHLKLSGFHMLAEPNRYDELAPVFARVMGEFGPERLMWGSDAPHQFRHGNSYAGCLEWIRTRSGATEAQLDWLLRRTAQTVFFDRA